ncbi:RNA 3'-phosphate cyclase [Candidatus Micrarchaeota archaeon]|nr:RNA 3'-phosphate cyclase [Candidatus Micrarchaeota archaeon]
MELIEIDGDYLEGGGQIIRTAMSLSAITKKPIKIINIRAKRPNPGLQAQHLTACKAVRSICRGTLEGAELGSKDLIFNPGEIVGGKYEFNIGTAGSVCLVAQTILPILFHAEKESNVRIIGGTHVMKAPSYDYFENIFMRAIITMGAKIKSKIIKPGYYPRGGGEIEIEAEPSKFNGKTEWEKENIVRVLIRVSNLPLSIAIREKKIFVQNEIENVKIYEEKGDIGNALLAWQDYRGSYALGEKGKRAEQVAQEALDELKKESNSDVDKHLADQLLLYAALANGKTELVTSEITDHFHTNAEIIKKFIKREIKIENNKVTIE